MEKKIPKKSLKHYELKKRTKWQKIGITVLILLVIQALSGVPTPGTNPDYFKQIISNNSAVGLFNLISGSGLSNMSITMLSITPYITASIILQLLTIVFPSLEEIQKDGETGRQRFKKITAWLGIVLAVMEAFGFAIGFGKQGLLISYKWYWVLLVTAIWTVTAALLIVAGEYIEKKAFGNGISLILLCNILSSYPGDASTMYEKFIAGNTLKHQITNGAIIFVCVAALFLFTIFIMETQKDIPVLYSGKMQGREGAKGNFPLKLCPGTVIPIIFASSLMSMPGMICTMIGKSYWLCDMLDSTKWFDVDNPKYSIGVVIYVVLIFAFSYFYTNIIVNPLEIANNFKKTGGCIVGVRPGQDTIEYLQKKINITTGVGAVGCCLIALIPSILSGVFGLSRLSFAGTSILITAGVLIETRDKYQAEGQTKKLALF